MRNRRYDADLFLRERFYALRPSINQISEQPGEIMTRQQMIENYSIERMGKTAAAFNQEKLDWMNGVYMRGLTAEDFTRRAMPFLEKDLPAGITRPLDTAYLRQVLPLVQERARKLTEIPALVKFFFIENLEYDPALLIAKNMTAESTLKALEAALPRLEKLEPYDDAGLEALLRPLAEELGIKAGQLFSALRTAVSGETATPPLFQMMTAMGKERCVKRIREAMGKLRA